jgi:uncharacterized protein YqeY
MELLLEQKIANDLKVAMKARDDLRTSCLRMLKTSLKNRQIEKGDKLTDQEVLQVIGSLIRKGQESVREYRKAGRQELAVKEEQEIRILNSYLPEQYAPEEIEKKLKEIITELSASGPKDLGRVMKVAMARMTGKVQGKEVNEIARKLLS